MENIRQCFGFETSYDLQSILFSNNLSVFHNRGIRRSTGIETVRRGLNHHHQMEAFSDHPPQEKDWNIVVNISDDESDDSLMDMVDDDTNAIPTITPLTVRFSEDVQAELQQR